MNFYKLLEKVYRHGNEVRPRGHLTKELLGESIILNKYNMVSSPECRPYEEIYKYWFQETCWYMSGDRDPRKIVRHAKMWGEITNEFGLINSNYGHRVFYRKNKYGLSGFDFALTCLQNDKESRNAIIIYNEPDLLYQGNKDFICSQHQHFMIRENKLICLISVRSWDLIFGAYFNLPWWGLVHQQMFLHLKRLYPQLTLGNIQVNVNSAHIYERHFNLVEKILHNPKHYHFIEFENIIPLNKEFEWYEANLKSYFSSLDVII